MQFTFECLKKAVSEKELFYHVSANVSSTNSYIVLRVCRDWIKFSSQ